MSKVAKLTGVVTRADEPPLGVPDGWIAVFPDACGSGKWITSNFLASYKEAAEYMHGEPQPHYVVRVSAAKKAPK